MTLPGVAVSPGVWRRTWSEGLCADRRVTDSRAMQETLATSLMQRIGGGNRAMGRRGGAGRRRAGPEKNEGQTSTSL